MEDQYNVNVVMTVESSGHHDPMFPDTTRSIEFNATDLNVEAVLEQFRDFLTMMGYVIAPEDSLKLVKE